MEVIREALGGPPRPVTWSDPDVLRSLFAPHAVTIAVKELTFTASSAEDFTAEHLDHHPMWLAITPALQAKGKLDEVVAKATAIFEAANEDPAAFTTTGAYHLATIDLR